MGPFILQGSVNSSSFYSILKDLKHSIYFEKKGEAERDQGENRKRNRETVSLRISDRAF